MRPPRDLTLLWALRSPCNLGCDYCYFGTLEEHREAPPTQPGQLSHLPHGDLNLADITRFLSTVDRSSVKRVFLAGGEPLIWPSIGHVIETLTGAGVEVTVCTNGMCTNGMCTNGIPLNRPAIRQMLLDTGVRGVSVSLDSVDPDTNDTHRPARNRKDGWHTVGRAGHQPAQASLGSLPTVSAVRLGRPGTRLRSWGAIQSVGRLDLHEAPDFTLTVFQLAQLNGSSAITQAFLKADEGWARALLGQTEDASRAIRKAKAMFEDADPDSARPSWMDPAQALPDLLSVTGAAQLQLGNLSEAVADLSRALPARPEAATQSRATDSAAERVAGLPTWKMARRLGLSRSSLQNHEMPW